MKIAVAYENGQINRHFGKTSQIKIYEGSIDEEEFATSETVDVAGLDQEKLAQLLEEKGVSVLLCGGIGVAARDALEKTKIQFFAGASGDADEQVKAFLSGKLHFDNAPACGLPGGEGGCAQCEFVGRCGHNCFLH